jgi:hypothetical protein
MSRSQVDTLKREFMALLQNHVLEADDGAREVSRMPAGSSPVMVTEDKS